MFQNSVFVIFSLLLDITKFKLGNSLTGMTCGYFPVQGKNEVRPGLMKLYTGLRSSILA